MTAETVAQLRALQARLADPERWTQGYYARTASGAACDPCGPEAVRWCIVGHYGAMAADDAVFDAVESAAQLRYQEDTVTVNDDRGLDAVRLVVTDAIAAAEAEGRTA